MIRDAHDANATTSPTDFEMARLRAALPEYFDKDGGFRLDRLQEALSSSDVSMTREGYELKFLGKSYAKYLTSTRTETVIVPDLEHNAESSNAESENLYIVGDNLDALKHLLGSYAGKVKCIYIDPPYNTGKDGFVYNDNFGFTAKQLVENIGLAEDEAERVISLQGKSSHSAWLTFMYPRLELAKNLITDDGVIFVSIDDNEQANLKILCDEIFGESNFIAGFIVVRSEGGGIAKQAIIGHDYLPAYCRNVEQFSPLGRPKDIRGAVVSIDGEDFWIETDWLRKEFGKYGNCPYEEIETYLGAKKKDEIDAGIAKGIYTLVPKNGMHLVGRLRKISEDTSKFYTVLKDFDGNGYAKHLNKFGVQDLEHLSLGSFFTNPKPVELIKRAVEGATIHTKNDADIVLDFFSGSATTAEAVMRQNAADGGNRHYILVQLPEPVSESSEAYQAGYRTIDEIGRDRITRAAERVKSDTGADIDYGFRLFRLEQPSARTLDQLQSFDPNEDDALLAGDFVSKFTSHGTPGDQVALSTWLVQDGFGLTPDVKDVELNDYELKVCEDSGYIINPGFNSDDAMALVAKLESGELDLKRIVVFGYSVPFSVMHELKQNLTSLRSGQSVSVIERY